MKASEAGRYLSRSNVVPVVVALGAVMVRYVRNDGMVGSVTLVSPLSRHIPVVEQACEVAWGQDREVIVPSPPGSWSFSDGACQDAGDLGVRNALDREGS